MNHYRHSGVDDTDSLQADVMRFMAIIAFCLIAILALVQKLDRTPSATQTRPVIVPHTEIETVETGPAPAAHAPAATTKETAPPTLMLRFTSDGAFLTLIDRQLVTLYGKTGQDFYRLRPEFHLEPVQLRGDLFQVMADSLPATVKAVYERKGRTDLFLVSLPEATARRISKMTEAYSDSGGQMLINRRGNVHYEPHR